MALALEINGPIIGASLSISGAASVTGQLSGGSIFSGSTISATTSISAGTTISATGNIRSTGGQVRGVTILSDSTIAATTAITAGTTIAATGDITSQGIVTAYSGVRLDDDTSAGGQSLLTYYRQLNHATTFTANAGGGTSASVNIRITRIGRQVTIEIPEFTCVVGATSGVITQNTALPNWALPYRQFWYVNEPVGTTVGTYAQQLTVMLQTSGILQYFSQAGGSIFPAFETVVVHGHTATYTTDN